MFDAAWRKTDICIHDMTQSNISRTLNICYLVHSYGFAVYLYHVHDLDGIVRVVLSHELHEPIVLVKLRDPVSWHVNIHYKPNILIL